jgi:hypothetical protein
MRILRRSSDYISTVVAATGMLFGQQSTALQPEFNPESRFFVAHDYSIPKMQIGGNDIESYFTMLFRDKNGWNIKELRKMQDLYFERLKIYKPYAVTNGIPNSILRLMPLIEEIAKDKSLDPMLVASVIRSESFGYQYAVGSVGELGLMQINMNSTKLTKSEYEEIFDPRTNISIGSSILKACLNKFSGNTMLALEAYNYGLENVLERRIPRETKEYGNSTIRFEKEMREK